MTDARGIVRWVTLGMMLLGSTQALGNVQLTRLVFPHVLKGTQGVYFESFIVITNTGDSTSQITLESALDLANGEFELAALESREITIAGEPFQTGAVRITSTQPVAAVVLLVSRPDQGSSTVLSEATVVATPLTSKVLLPVHVGGPIVEDTGIAIAYSYAYSTLKVRFTLYDAGGQEVATRTEQAGFDPGSEFPSEKPAAFLITELFPELPADFIFGSLVIEQISGIADIFGVTALYIRAGKFWAGEVTPVDDSRSYIVKPESLENMQQTAELLAVTYGFEIHLIVNDFIAIRATREVARAVSRDPQVREVCPDLPLDLSLAGSSRN